MIVGLSPARTRRLELNLVPELSRGQVAEELAAFRARWPGKAVANANPFALPKRLWAAVVIGRPPDSTVAGSAEAAEAAHDGGGGGGGGGGGDTDVGRAVDPSTRWDALSSADLRALEARMCRALLPFSGKDSNKDEFVTAGGICWSGVNAARMESRHVEGLFFAGELLDVDGVTGGHNFQSCWSTGFVVGNAAAEHAAREQAAEPEA